MGEKYDFLVLGSGLAGLSYALKVAESGTVAIVTKDQATESNTRYAQGGIAAVMASNDSFEEHIQDTLNAGADLCQPNIVSGVIKEGPKQINRLIELGTQFSHKNGKLDLVQEGGHSKKRVVHSADTTGQEIKRALLLAVKKHPNIKLFEYHFALDLITEHHLGQTITRVRPDIHCFGAYVLDQKSDRVKTFLAKATLLACGGAGQVYSHTTNPAIATGDGIAMAYRAKARIANMEFIQFHPTALFQPNAAPFLISEAVRGEGGRLLNQKGEAFMKEYDPRAELAPRDIVARAIDDQLKRHGDQYVWLDISHKPAAHIQEHFPNIFQKCLQAGIDITQQPIPVVPSAHYICGGVYVDEDGRTSVHGLFAAGEVSCTGLHGANRLASNSLLEALVFSKRAAKSSKEYAEKSSWKKEIPAWDDGETKKPNEWILVSHNLQELQQVMSNYVGIVRSNFRLERAARRTHLLYKETEEFYRKTRVSGRLCELRNLIAVAFLIIRSSQLRKESRGLHFNVDFPQKKSIERRDTLL